MGWRHWTTLRRNDHIGWPFMNVTGTGRGERHSHFTSQWIQRHRKTKGKWKLELDLKKENSSNARTKAAPENCFENSVKFRAHERLQDLGNEACTDLNKLVLIAGYSSLQMLPVQSQQWHNCYMQIWLRETLNTPCIALKPKNHLHRGMNFQLRKLGQSMEQELPDFGTDSIIFHSV